MRGRIEEEKDVIPFARVRGGVPDQLDQAGETILQLVQQAAGIADDNSRHALEMAQQLSDKLRAAEDRVAELEADLATYRERAERAEEWLHRVYGEIEERFMRQPEQYRRATNGSPQGQRRAR